MADEGVVLGASLGALVVLGLIIAVVLIMRNQNQQQQSHDPRLVQHNVIRDEQGRIKQVETFQGMGGVSSVPAQDHSEVPEDEWATA